MIQRLVVLSCVLASVCAVHASGPVTLTIDVHARSVAPGEPLRVVVTSPVPLQSVAGTFLGHDVFFARVPSDGGAGESWSGWAMVALDDRPGPATLDARGRTADGVEARGTRALRVLKKVFPEERLKVPKEFVEPPPETAERIRREQELLRGLYRVNRDVPPPAGPFVQPVPGEPSAEFGKRRFFNGQPRAAHPGIDLRAATGTDVRAAGAGLVVLAQDLYFSGNTVIVDHGGGLFTVYAHFSRIDVKAGDPVERGQHLGLSGATGRVTGPHLHWGAKLGDRTFDPRALLAAALW